MLVSSATCLTDPIKKSNGEMLMEMPPINMLDPYILGWIARTSQVIEKDGEKFWLPMTHWPDGQPVNYIGDELQKSHPDFVETGPDGNRYINFPKYIAAMADEFPWVVKRELGIAGKN
jgi:hypothetical protein